MPDKPKTFSTEHLESAALEFIQKRRNELGVTDEDLARLMAEFTMEYTAEAARKTIDEVTR